MAILIAAGFGAGYLVGNGAQGTITFTSVSTSTQTYATTSTLTTTNGSPLVFASGVAANGLKLEMTLNATSMSTQGAISGQVEVTNTLDQNVSFSTLGQSQNLSIWNNYINVCPSTSFVGYTLFSGHFNAGNISSAGTPLELVPLTISSCGGGAFPDTATILHNSDQSVGNASGIQYLVSDLLNMTTLICNPTGSSQNGSSCNDAMPGLVGFWDYSVSPQGNAGLTSPALALLSRGVHGSRVGRLEPVSLRDLHRHQDLTAQRADEMPRRRALD